MNLIAMWVRFLIYTGAHLGCFSVFVLPSLAGGSPGDNGYIFAGFCGSWCALVALFLFDCRPLRT